MKAYIAIALLLVLVACAQPQEVPADDTVEAAEQTAQEVEQMAQELESFEEQLNMTEIEEDLALLDDLELG